MATVSVEYDEFNNLKQKEAELEILRAKFDSIVKTEKQKLADDLISAEKGYDKRLLEFEENKGIIVVQVKGHVVKEEWLLKDLIEDIEEYDFTKDLDLVKINEEISRKSYVNMDYILDPLKKEALKDLEDEYSALKEQLTNKFLKENQDWIDVADKATTTLKKHLSDHKDFLDEHEILAQQNEDLIEKLTSMKFAETVLVESKESLKEKLSISKKDLETTVDDVSYYRDLLDNTKTTLIQQLADVKSTCKEKIEELVLEQSEKIVDIKEEVKTLADDLSKEKAVLKEKFNFDPMDRVLIVKDYEDLSSMSKYLLKKIYIKHDMHEANFASDINRNKTQNDEFIKMIANN